MIRLLIIAFTGCVFLASTPSDKRPVTHEDIWLMKRVGPPKASPDGQWVVFSVTNPAYDAKEQNSDLWLKSLATDQPARQITFTKGVESDVVWAPNSRSIAFVTKREGDEAPQLYVLDLAGGEAQRYTSLTLGVSTPKWSPDGTRILFSSDVYPKQFDESGIAKEAKARRERKDTSKVYEQFPIRRWDHWLDDVKPSLFVMEAKPNAKPKNILAESKFLEAPGNGGNLGGFGFSLEGQWTPDGTGVVFTSTVNLNQAAFGETETHLFYVSAKGGEPKRLTSQKRSIYDPAFSPDGKFILCLTEPIDDGTAHCLKLTRYPWPFEEAPTILSESLDKYIPRFVVQKDRIWFTYEDAGLERLHSIPVAGGPIRDELQSLGGCIASLSAGGNRLVGQWEKANQPSEIFEFTAAAARPITSFNQEAISKLALQDVEHVWSINRKGKRIHSLLVKPAAFDPRRKYPLLLIIHGGAAAMSRDAFGLRWNYHLLAKSDYVLLLTDYTGSSGYGEAFMQGISLDPLKGPGEDLLDAMDDTIRRYPFVDGNRMAALGASYGGHLCNWLQATSTRFKAIVSHAGEMDLALQWGTSDGIFSRERDDGGPVWGPSAIWRDQSPLYQAGNHAKGTGFKTPILITAGERDQRVSGDSQN